MSTFTPHQRAVLEAVEMLSFDHYRPQLGPVARMAGLRPKPAARAVAALVSRGVLAYDDRRHICAVGSPDPEPKEEPMAQQVEVFEYVTAPSTDTVHLIRQDAYTGTSLVKTLCGRPAGGWTMGDETASGIAATCRRCRFIAFHGGTVAS